MPALKAALASRAVSERRLLIGALLLGAAIRIGYVLASRHVQLGGDEPYYDQAAILQHQGKWFWGNAPYGTPHETLQKAPIYPLWVGTLYTLLGEDPDRVRLVQAIVSVLTIGLGWLLGRRLLGPRAGIAAAFVLAVYPNAWQFDVRLFPEAVATPLTVALLLVVLTCCATPRMAALAGALLGLNLLVRPSAVLFVVTLGVTWWSIEGLRRGVVLVLAASAVAVVVIAPWAIRNHVVEPDHFVPISTQDQAAYGSFNDDAAHDSALPYKWRPRPSRDSDLFASRPPLSDGELHDELLARVRSYVRDHPDSVPKAFFWNGVVRLWDLRPPSQVTDDATFGHRSRTLSAIGLAIYWPLLLLASIGLVRLWRGGRKALVLGVAATALAASVAYTSDAGTRYRAPFEPIIVVLAMGAFFAVPVQAGGNGRPSHFSSSSTESL